MTVQKRLLAAVAAFGLLSSTAWAATPDCSSCEQDWSQNQELELFGQEFPGSSRKNGISDYQETVRGVTEEHWQEWVFEQDVWQVIATSVANQVPVPGQVVQAVLYTDHDTPITTLDAGNVAAMSVITKDGKTFEHHLFKRTGGAWAPVPQHHDLMNSAIPCSAGSALQYAHVPDRDMYTLYNLKMDSEGNQFSALNKAMDFDLLAELWTATATAGSVVTGYIWEPNPATIQQPGDGLEPPEIDGEPSTCGNGHGLCRDSVSSGPDCNMSNSGPAGQCHTPETTGEWVWKKCGYKENEAKGHIAANAISPTELFAFQMRLMGNPLMVRWVGSVYVYSYYVKPSPAQGAAWVAGYEASQVIMHGSGNDTVITPSRWATMKDGLKEAHNVTPRLDTIVSELEGILDAQVGNSRDQFCTEVFGNAACE